MPEERQAGPDDDRPSPEERQPGLENGQPAPGHRVLARRAESMAREAGDLLRRHYGSLRRADADRKGGAPRNLVSRADLESEQWLRAAVPEGDDILAEEGESRSSGARRRWVIDPLDGTVNFLHGIPFWCVSIAVLEDERLVAAVVHAPALGQTFTAVAGGGCRLDGRPVRVSETAELGEAILASGFPYRRNELADNNLDNFATMGLAAGGLRRMGSAAIDMAYVACGRLDGFWELHLEPWDVAAGTLLVREAGGTVTDFAGSPHTETVLHGRNIVASNGPLHDEIRARLAPLAELGARLG